jgi:hypothetical protein
MSCISNFISWAFLCHSSVLIAIYLIKIESPGFSLKKFNRWSESLSYWDIDCSMCYTPFSTKHLQKAFLSFDQCGWNSLMKSISSLRIISSCSEALFLWLLRSANSVLRKLMWLFTFLRTKIGSISTRRRSFKQILPLSLTEHSVSQWMNQLCLLRQDPSCLSYWWKRKGFLYCSP